MTASVAAPAPAGGAPDAAADVVVLCEFCWAPAPAAGVTVRLFRWPAGGGPPRIHVVRFGGVRPGQLPSAACITGVVTAAAASGGDSVSDSRSRSSSSTSSRSNSSSSSSNSSSSSSRKRRRAPADCPLAGGAPGPRTRLTPARLVTLLAPSSGVATTYTVRTSLPRSATAAAVTNGDALPPRPRKTTVRLAAALHDWSTDAASVSAALRAVLTRAGHPVVEVGTLVDDASATARVTAALRRTAAVSAYKQGGGFAPPALPRSACGAGGWQRRRFGAPSGAAAHPVGAGAASGCAGWSAKPAAGAVCLGAPPPPRPTGTATDDSAVSLVSGGIAAWSLTGVAGAGATVGDRPTGGVDGSAASWITTSEAPRAGVAAAVWPAGGSAVGARRGRPAAGQVPPVAVAAPPPPPAAVGAAPAGIAAWHVGARGPAGVAPGGNAAAAQAGHAAGDAGAAPWPPPLAL
ncbi:hypothetical protein BU14_1139s0002 [Porphyra umbilicalis]|uniref:Uncharacterized protein n=1 Tax=Porphyra umbilicalis TaxID=2786 RepID=A0A1X6NME0_PORUM|nr:hypothetical protein BU14_1139s0002 [Porphyra umbilicalis]|eukprot:OSX69801.1 hypothetical protein BU14_1139s0002 [Porphyra umbilicalis]